MSEKVDSEIQLIYPLLTLAATNLKTLCILTPTIITPELNVLIGEDITNLILDYIKLSEEYDDIMTLNNNIVDELPIAKKLIELFNTICYELNKNKNIFTILKKNKNIIKTHWFSIVNVLFDFFDIFESHLKNPIDEITAESNHSEQLFKLKDLKYKENNLKDALNIETAARLKSEKHHNLKEISLIADIERLKESNKNFQLDLVITKEQQEEKEKLRFQKVIDKLNADLLAEEKMSKEISESNMNIESTAKRRYTNTLEDIEHAKTDYERRIGEATKILNAAEEEFNRDDQYLREMKDKIFLLRKGRQEREAKIFSEQIDTDRTAGRRLGATITIQRYYRGYITRKHLIMQGKIKGTLYVRQPSRRVPPSALTSPTASGNSLVAGQRKKSIISNGSVIVNSNLKSKK